MSEPGNADDVPAGCPRLRDGGAGPRACELVQCRSNLRETVDQLDVVTDECARDVGKRVKCRGVLTPHKQIGALLGVTKQRAQQIEKQAIDKARILLKIRP